MTWRAISARSYVKSVLLDQKVAAGVGNWIADEVLYHSVGRCKF